MNYIWWYKLSITGTSYINNIHNSNNPLLSTLVGQARADIWQELLALTPGEPRGETGGGRGGEAGCGRVPVGEVRLVLGQRVVEGHGGRGLVLGQVGFVLVQLAVRFVLGEGSWNWRWKTGICCVQRWWVGSGVVAVESVHSESFLAVNLEMFPQRGGVGVGLVAASHPAVVRLVRGVDMHVLLPVARVGEPSVTARNLALERFLTCR